MLQLYLFPQRMSSPAIEKHVFVSQCSVHRNILGISALNHRSGAIVVAVHASRDRDAPFSM
jgi:hypothetical protein